MTFQRYAPPIRYSTYLAQEVAAYQRYLDHDDPAIRAVGLEGIQDTITLLLVGTNASPPPQNEAPQQAGCLARITRHIKRFLLIFHDLNHLIHIKEPPRP